MEIKARPVAKFGEGRGVRLPLVRTRRPLSRAVSRCCVIVVAFLSKLNANGRVGHFRTSKYNRIQPDSPVEWCASDGKWPSAKSGD
jgi:hypothetical protein